jgi:hypothetical protein
MTKPGNTAGAFRSILILAICEGAGVKDDKAKPLSHKGRSGSENRQKQRRITFRLTEVEYATLETSSAGAGLSLASHVRETLLNVPETRSRRRPLADVAALARLFAGLNKIGGNINQITRRVNFGETPSAAEFSGALAGIRETMAAIRAAMGLTDK